MESKRGVCVGGGCVCVFYCIPHLVLTGVLYDLGAQVAALDGPQMLLVRLPVAGVCKVEVMGCQRVSPVRIR